MEVDPSRPRLFEGRGSECASILREWRLVGNGRFKGLETTQVLARVYTASRLHVNFFQPSFKTSGAKVCARLRELYRTLDPVALPAEVRAAWPSLARASMFGLTRTRSWPQPPARDQRSSAAADVAAFAKGLGNDVRLGEQRIIHRRTA